MREYAADIEGLLDELGITRAAIVGLSMGGLVTMELAVSQPERYWAIGLVATTAEPVTPQERATRLERADAVERDGLTVLVDYMHTGLYGPACLPNLGSRTRVQSGPARISPGSRARLRALRRWRAGRLEMIQDLASVVALPGFTGIVGRVLLVEADEQVDQFTADGLHAQQVRQLR
jgi:pimeloyl-ACP methyl ester carboxylesterase